MNLARALWFHTSVLALSGALAGWAYTRDKTASGVAQEGEVTLWSGRSADVQRIVYEAKDRKVVLEQQPGAEPWYRITFERTPAPLGPDAGAAPVKPAQIFPGNEAAKKVVESVAPLRASRTVGKLAGDKAAEYGLDKKDTSVTVVLAGRERKLFIGEDAPGGSDLYVLDPATGEAYVVKSEHLRALQQAESRLMERDLHAWKDAEIKKAKITAGGKSRDIVRGGPDTHRFWADPSASDKADETVENWIQKADRLKAIEYTQKDPEGAVVVARVDYMGASSPLGFFQLSKSPDPMQPGKSQYWVLSERTHMYGKATASLAEQLEQDVGSILK